MRITVEEYHNALELLQKYREQIKADLANIEVELGQGTYPSLKYTTLYELVDTGKCSFRLYSVIFHKKEVLNIPIGPGTKTTVGDLEGVSLKALYECQNVGAKTVDEFKKLCGLAGVRWNP